MPSAKRPSLGAIFLTICLDLLGFGLALPFLAEVARSTFHVSSFVGTLLASSYSLMQFLFVPLWGRLSDRVGRKPVLAWSVAATAVGNLALALALAYANHIAWVFAARMFAGIATANLGTASAYIADVTSARDRAKGMALIGMAFGFGFVLGPGFGGLLAQIPLNHRHGPYALLVAAGLSVINLVWVLLGLVESLPPESRKLADPTRRRKIFDLRTTTDVLRVGSIARAVSASFVLVLFFSGMEQTMRFFNADGFAMSLGATGGLLVLVGLTAAAVQGGIVRRLSGRVEDASMLRWGLLNPGGGVRGHRGVAEHRAHPPLHVVCRARARQWPHAALRVGVRVEASERERAGSNAWRHPIDVEPRTRVRTCTRGARLRLGWDAIALRARLCRNGRSFHYRAAPARSQSCVIVFVDAVPYPGCGFPSGLQRWRR